MPSLKTLLVLSTMSIVLPALAAGEAQSEQPAERPQREAVKLSPSPRESAPRPDESGKMKRIAPPRAESPLQHVPALMDPPPGAKSPAKP